MSIEELQREWQAIEIEPYSESELRSMMYAARAPRMRSMQGKEIRNFALKLLVIVAFCLGFVRDWASGIWLLISFIGLLDEYLGLRYMRLLPQKDTIRNTLLSALSKMKRAMLLSRLAYACMWLVVVLIAATKMDLGFWNTVLLGLATLPLLFLMSWWSSRKWSLKVGEVNAMLKEFNEEPEVAVGT